MKKAPAFWWDSSPQWKTHGLAPLSKLWGLTASYILARSAPHASLPVISVGNFVMGGSGKTPTAQWIGAFLKTIGERPFFLSRGYKGRLSGFTPVRVDPSHHTAEDVGDEPLLLAQTAPVIIGINRWKSALLAQKQGASCLILDDGWQNRSLAKDLQIVVVDGERGIGNGLCFPAGPLRAPLTLQWRYADCVLILGEGQAGTQLAQEAQIHQKQVFHFQLVPPQETLVHLPSKPVIAFCGLGHPEKFFRLLRHLGLTCLETYAFPDHYLFTPQDLVNLQERAQQQQALLITTEKDHVRLKHQKILKDLDYFVLPINLHPLTKADECALKTCLTQVIKSFLLERDQIK